MRHKEVLEDARNEPDYGKVKQALASPVGPARGQGAGRAMADTAVAPAQRTLPHNLEAERSVLGAILIHNDAFNLAAQVIDSGDFYRDDHRRIFDCMVALNERNAAIDFVTLKEELSRGGQLDAVGGPAYVAGARRRRAPGDQRRVLRADRQGEVHPPQPDLRRQQDPDQRVRSRPGSRRHPGRGRERRSSPWPTTG